MSCSATAGAAAAPVRPSQSRLTAPRLTPPSQIRRRFSCEPPWRCPRLFRFSRVGLNSSKHRIARDRQKYFASAVIGSPRRQRRDRIDSKRYIGTGRYQRRGNAMNTPKSANIDLEKHRLRRFVDRLIDMGDVAIHDEPVALTSLGAAIENTEKALLFKKAGPEQTEIVAKTAGSRKRVIAAFDST